MFTLGKGKARTTHESPITVVASARACGVKILLQLFFMQTQIMSKANDVNGAGPKISRAGFASDTGAGVARSVTSEFPTNGFKATHKIKKDGKFRVASLNVGTLRGKSLEVVGILSERRVDVCCLQEVRWKGGGAKVATYKLFWKGGEKGEAGVGVMVEKRWIDKVLKVERLNERCMLLRLMCEGEVVNILSVYAPQVGREREEKEEFWQDLSEFVGEIPSEEKIILAGDLNGHIGERAEGYEEVHGGFGYGVRNGEGESILEFAKQQKLVVCNSFFKKEKEKFITYNSGGNRSMLDYILVRSRDRRYIINWNSVGGMECVKQHKLVMCDMKLREQRGLEKKKYEPRIKIWKLREWDIREKFKKRVKEELCNKECGEGVNETWTEMRDVLRSAATEVCGIRRGPPRHRETWWWTREVEEVVRYKRKCFRKWKRSKSVQDKGEYVRARQKAKKVVAKAKDRANEELADELESDEGKQKIFKMAKQMSRERADVTKVNCIKDSRGRLILDEIGKKRVWKEYMEKLLNEENEWDGEVGAEKKEGPECEISKEEVEKVMRRMKTGKAAGQSGIVTEMIKAMGEEGILWITELCNRIVWERKIPDDWQRSTLVPIYKGKGDPLECGSYRAIKLLEHGMKILEKVLERRLRQIVELDEMQFGFTPGRGTTDAIFIVRQMQEKYRAKKRPLYYAFVDLEKAYDRIPREVVRWALREAGVDEWLVDTVMCTYKNARTVVQTDDGLTEEFEVGVGLHQGSALSPVLFIIVMDRVCRKIRGGLPWELLYADDLALMAQDLDELRDKLRKWKRDMEAKGMRVNLGKTKVMWGGSDCRRDYGVKFPCAVCDKGVGSNSILCEKCEKWTHKKCSGVKGSLSRVNNFECSRCSREAKSEGVENSDEMEIEPGLGVERVDRFCYLGEMLGEEGGADLAVANRVGKAWGKFNTMAPLLCNKSITGKVKGMLYMACVRSCLLYGSETWALTKENERKLVNTENRMIRKMSRLRDGIPVDMTRQEMGVMAISEAIKLGRLRWFGHVKRRDEGNWVRKCMDMEIEGKNPKGRPKRTWRQVVKDDLKLMGVEEEEAEDRDCWRFRLDCMKFLANL